MNLLNSIIGNFMSKKVKKEKCLKFISTNKIISHFSHIQMFILWNNVFVMSNEQRNLLKRFYMFLSTTQKADKLFIFIMLFNTSPISAQTISYKMSENIFSWQYTLSSCEKKKKKYTTRCWDLVWYIYDLHYSLKKIKKK